MFLHDHNSMLPAKGLNANGIQIEAIKLIFLITRTGFMGCCPINKNGLRHLHNDSIYTVFLTYEKEFW